VSDGAADRAPWHGVWGFPLTPFRASGIDADLLAEGTELQISGGVDVVCACGLIAQLEQLTAEEHQRTVETAIAAAAARVPVVVTVRCGADTPGASAAAHAAEHGAAGVVAVPTGPDLASILTQLRAIADAAPGLPQALYHRPPLALSAGDLQTLAAAVPELVWVKDGHRDARMYRLLRAAVPRLRWVSAWEDVALAFWGMGVEAFAPASTAYAPGYAGAWLGHLRDGDLGGARELLAAHAYPIVDLRLSRPGIDVSVVKEAMAAFGLPTGVTRPPAQPLTEAERARVRELVGRVDEVLAAAARDERRSPH
jgi:dihydrodipicolinate synthase/N-acetylneuraminate lyase